MWDLQPTDEFVKRRKKWPKKHKRELLAMLDNLDMFHRSLCAGAKNAQAQAMFGFAHPEPLGIVAIDQRGRGGGTKESRLYVYAEEPSSVLHLITIGDKSTQSNDIELCKVFVKELLADVETEKPRPAPDTERVTTHDK
ncbi:MAG: hypothetical protein KDA42_04130 [Planctomycetales bacterium]|nr:hypothetical protein [Planctomycetales bacterium]